MVVCVAMVPPLKMAAVLLWSLVFIVVIAGGIAAIVVGGSATIDNGSSSTIDNGGSATVVPGAVTVIVSGVVVVAGWWYCCHCC